MSGNTEDQRQQLVGELERLRAALKRGRATDYTESERLLALVRIYPGLTLEAWKSLAEQHSLRQWLAVPLDGDISPALAHLLRTLDELSFLTEHDPLTGLANRRAFDRVLDLEIERAQRNVSQLSLAVLDIDDFKRVNDTYGHGCGDAVLKDVAGLIRRFKRRYELAARIGGEEFSIIFPGVGLLAARSAMGRLLGALRAHPFSCGGDLFNLTCSIGLASYKGKVEISGQALFELADKALYKAKEQGKNRVMIAHIPDHVLPKKTLVHSSEKRFLFTGR